MFWGSLLSLLAETFMNGCRLSRLSHIGSAWQCRSHCVIDSSGVGFCLLTISPCLKGVLHQESQRNLPITLVSCFLVVVLGSCLLACSFCLFGGTKDSSFISIKYIQLLIHFQPINFCIQYFYILDHFVVVVHAKSFC